MRLVPDYQANLIKFKNKKATAIFYVFVVNKILSLSVILLFNFFYYGSFEMITSISEMGQERL